MRAALLTLALLPLLACAQSWCPPGATWTYDHTGFVGLQGYSVMTYTHDTVLAGEVGQLIDLVVIGVDVNQVVDTLPWPTPSAITRYTADQVFLWSGLTQSWDTLYDFAVVPGDKWLPPHADPGICPPGNGDVIEVLDTGTVVIDGMVLRYVDVHCGFYDGRITERLGWSLGMVMFEGCFVPECSCDLRCYRDDSLSYVRPGLTLPCDHLDLATAVEMDLQGQALVVAPNPGTDHFTLSGVEGYLPPGRHTITLFDATGRIVLQQRTADVRPMIDTGALPSGLYRVAVRDEQGAVLGATWVKE
ncbi:MAG: T9SS type A sorting domain-containing protein [Flavobacteriales bacterium]|nr:T9SS type A sorting domain-containing protein [Flavobacteriales bacterium]